MPVLVCLFTKWQIKKVKNMCNENTYYSTFFFKFMNYLYNHSR